MQGFHGSNQRKSTLNDTQEKEKKLTLVQWLGRRIVSMSTAALTIVVVTTAAGFFARDHWVADIFTNLRVQQIIGLLGIGAILTIGRQWKWLVVTIALLCIHAPWFSGALVRAIPTGGQESLSQPELVVMTANVLTSNRQHDAVLEQIESANADVFAILELSTPLQRRLEEELANAYPHQIALPQDGGNFGIGLYSRHPLLDIDSFSTNVPSIQSIGATVKSGSKLWRIIATHPLPPMGQEGFESRNEHLQILGDRVSELRDADKNMAVIVMGDLNVTPWSPLFSDFESRSGLTLAGGSNEIIPTWYVRPMFPFGLVLDHVLISDDLQCVRREVGPDIGSDHRAVIVAITSKDSES